MMPSLDGRIVTKPWDIAEAGTKEYERTAATFDADAWIIGRISMEPYAGKTRVSRRKPAEPIAREDFIAKKADSYAIAIDPSGKLTWTSDNVDGEHFITVLTEGVSDAYLAFLREQGVSYIFAGAKTINLKKALLAVPHSHAAARRRRED
jgi:2,5-diamino-6-(ribosylamino)-4(3H)-pyrimidinone 5'-phosphate reductase